jgi:hypothetical protein
MVWQRSAWSGPGRGVVSFTHDDSYVSDACAQEEVEHLSRVHRTFPDLVAKPASLMITREGPGRPFFARVRAGSRQLAFPRFDGALGAYLSYIIAELKKSIPKRWGPATRGTG